MSRYVKIEQKQIARLLRSHYTGDKKEDNVVDRIAEDFKAMFFEGKLRVRFQHKASKLTEWYFGRKA